jgi:tetratricopeptide (TPR) repeat protein
MNTLLRLAYHVARFFTFYASYFKARFRRRPRKPPEPAQVSTEELLQRGSQEVQRGHYDEGIALLEQALEREPANFVAHVNVGSAYYLRAEERQRAAAVQPPPLMKEGPGGGNAEEVRAAVAADLTSSVRHFNHVLALDPNHTQALLNLAAAYSCLDRLDESIEMLERVLRINPQHPDGHYNLATAYLRRGNRTRAMEELRKELEVNPRSPHAPDLLRELERERGK